MAKTNPEELTKVERSRQERKERLEAQKTGSGDKKSLHVKKKRSWVMPTLVVVAILLIAAWLLNGYGVPQRFLTAMTVGGEPVKVSEYNYYYNNMRNSYARMVGDVDVNETMPFSPPSATKDDDSDETKSDKPNPTWGEFFHQQAQDRIQTTKILVKKASEEGIELDDSDIAEIDTTIAAMKKEQGSDLAFNNDLIRRYGKGFNEAELRKVFSDALLVEKYKRERLQKIEISDDKIESYYDQHRDEIDAVSYKYADVFVDPSTIQLEDLPEEQQESLKKIKDFEAKLSDASSAEAEEATTSVAETTPAEDKTEVSETTEATTAKSSETSSEAKSEDKKSEDKKSEDKKSEDKKSDDKKSDDKKSEDKKSDEKKTEASSEAKGETTGVSEAKSTEATTSAEETAEAKPTQTYDEALKEAQVAEAKSRSEKIAEKMLTAVEAGQDLQKLVQENKEFVVNSEFSPQGENPVSVTNKKAQIQVPDLSTWLYDAERKQGDTTLIKTDNGHCYVAVYAKRGPDKRLSADIQARILTKETLNALSDDERQKMVDELLKRFPAEVKSVEDLKAFKLGDLDIDAALDLPGFTAGHGLNDVSMKQILSTTVKENTPLVIEENGNYYLIFVTARGPLESYRSDIQKQLREEAYTDEVKAMKESTENAIELKGLAKHFFYDAAEALKPAA